MRLIKVKNRVMAAVASSILGIGVWIPTRARAVPKVRRWNCEQPACSSYLARKPRIWIRSLPALFCFQRFWKRRIASASTLPAVSGDFSPRGGILSHGSCPRVPHSLLRSSKNAPSGGGCVGSGILLVEWDKRRMKMLKEN